MNEAYYKNCVLCPRMCGVDRTQHTGFCRCTDQIIAARAALHQWEEPCISGVRGSGTVFFSGCTLHCCFCQNFDISQEMKGKILTIPQLSDIFLRLQEEGAHNINLVTATHYLPSVLKALDAVKHRLTIPVVYNSSGFERTETIAELDGYIDIYLPDFKYMDARLSSLYSQAEHYFEYAQDAILAMIHQVGAPNFLEESDTSCRLMKKGVILRHMILPGQKEDSISLLHWIKGHLPEGSYLLSLLSQYTPFYKSHLFPELNRRITSYEYYKVVDTAIELGLTDGYMQEKSSAREEYTPPFDLEGLDLS